MSGVLGFVIIIWIIRAASSSKEQGTSGNSKPTSYLLACINWAIFLGGYFSIEKNNPNWAYVFAACYSPLLIPSIYAALTTRLGWAKISFYLGKVSIVYFGRNPAAGGLILGLKACQRLKNEQSKKPLLLWFKNKIASRNEKIFSGEMVMSVIIDSYIQYPDDPHQMAKQLDLLKDIGTASIPKMVADYAVRLALVPALKEKNWPKINQVCQQWIVPAGSPLATYIAMTFDRFFLRRIPFFQYQLLKLKFRNYKLLNRRLREYGEIVKKQLSSTPDKFEIRHLWRIESLNDNQIAQAQNQLTASRQIWRERSQALGVWDFEAAWETLEKSVNKSIALRSQQASEIGEEEYYQLEREYKKLGYLCDAIERRMQEKKLGSGIQNYQDWIRIKAVLDCLSVDESVYHGAFTSAHHTIWNWIAALWNDKKEHCLVHFIAASCVPVAGKCGQKEFHNMLLGLTFGNYK